MSYSFSVHSILSSSINPSTHTNPLLIALQINLFPVKITTKFLSNKETGGERLITMRSRLIGIAMQVLVMAIVISVVLLLVGIVVLVCVHICIVGKALRHSFSLGDDNTRGRERGDDGGGRGLSPEDLKELPRCDYVMQEDKESKCCRMRGLLGDVSGWGEV